MNVDSSAWGEFKVGDLFGKPKLGFMPDPPRKFVKAADTSAEKNEEFSVPLTNAKYGNNGIMYYGRPGEWSTAEKTIGVVSNGAVAVGSVYVHNPATSVIDDSYLLTFPDDAVVQDPSSPGEPPELSEEVLLFVATVLEAVIRPRYSYDDKAVWSKVSQETIRLPQTPEGTPDWQAMHDFVRERRKRARENVEALLRLA